MTQTPGQVRDLLNRHGISPRRSLGQHFLADPNITAKIAALAPVDRPALEIGTGTGALTAALATRVPRVVTYEVDARLEPVLFEMLKAFPNVEIRFEDVTTVAFEDTLEGPWSLVANLPYNVGIPVLLDLIRRAPMIDPFIVMVQAEVADRLVAEPGTKQYGVPSITARLLTDVRIEFSVPAQVFVPRPAVSSAVVSLARGRPPTSLTDRAVDLASAAFGQRRKMLKSSLSTEVPDPLSLIERSGLDPRWRAEDLQPDDYLTLATTEASR